MALSTLTSAEQLRLLNLGYRHLQRDFRRIFPDLFRTYETLTTDSSGFIELPLYALEIELIEDSNGNPLKKIDLEQKNSETGWYHSGVSTVNGKRKLMVRSNGAASAANASYIVHFTREYSDLASTTATPYPFTGKLYLDMLTTLQTYYWFIEQGQEKKKDADQQLAHYQMLYEMATAEYEDDEPTYGITSHGDAGNARSYPILTPSSS